jgi:hypothetical protein
MVASPAAGGKPGDHDEPIGPPERTGVTGKVHKDVSRSLPVPNRKLTAACHNVGMLV